MASLELDTASGRYRVRFRYSGQEFKRSLRTSHRSVATAGLGQVAETIRLLEMGMAELPPNVDPGVFIVSGARTRREQRPQSPVQTLAELFSVYEKELPQGAKEAKTLEGEAIHKRHLLRHLGSKSRVAAISLSHVQRYVELRSQDRFNGQQIGPCTIKKELSTLRLVWNWAKRQSYVETEPPVDKVVYPKTDEKPPYMTMAEIECILARGNDSAEMQEGLWESLYLTRPEIDELLETVRNSAKKPFIYPMFLLAAHTGMRRSELVRCEINDLDFANRTILVREKKRSRKFSLSFRRVPMSSVVERVFTQHFTDFPPSKYALTPERSMQLKERYATSCFRKVLDGGRWQNVKGFHVFRHSFASNAAIEGVDQRMIDEWMGHQTEEMRGRYRHLLLDRQREALESVYGSV